MTATKATERYIVQQLLHNRRRPRGQSLAERIITGLALVASVTMLLASLQGLLGVMLVNALMDSLGLR